MSLILMQDLCSQLLNLVRESVAKALEVLLPCPVFPWGVKGINVQTFNNIVVLVILCIRVFLDGGQGNRFLYALRFLIVVNSFYL